MVFNQGHKEDQESLQISNNVSIYTKHKRWYSTKDTQKTWSLSKSPVMCHATGISNTSHSIQLST